MLQALLTATNQQGQAADSVQTAADGSYKAQVVIEK